MSIQRRRELLNRANALVRAAEKEMEDSDVSVEDSLTVAAVGLLFVAADALHELAIAVKKMG